MFIEFYIVEYYKYLIFFFFFNKYTLSNNKRCINLDTINLSISQYPIKRLLNVENSNIFQKSSPELFERGAIHVLLLQSYLIYDQMIVFLLNFVLFYVQYGFFAFHKIIQSFVHVTNIISPLSLRYLVIRY